MRWGLVLAVWAQDVAEEPTEPTVAPLVHAVETGVNEAKAAAHVAFGAAARSRAEQNAAQAQGVQAQAELAAAKVDAEKPPLQVATALAVQAGADAAASAAAANAALESVHGMQEPVVAEAAVLAKKEVHSQLAKMYKELDGWRNRVLVDPYEEAKKAGVAAAKPYYDSMKVYQARIGEYSTQANLAAGQATGLTSKAEAQAAGAQAKMSAGNVIGANQDLVNAKRMMEEAQTFKSQANSLQGMIGQMNGQVPQYVAAAHLAAWRKEYETNPNAFPPPPSDVNAFTPGPVALLQDVVKPLPRLLRAR